MKRKLPVRPCKASYLVLWAFILLITACSNLLPQKTPLPGLITIIPTTDILDNPLTSTEYTAHSSTAVVMLPTRTVSPTFMQQFTSTVISSPRPTRMVTPALGPTFTIDERNTRLLELLETNGDCTLPCIWGIMPGETEENEAFQILYPLGNPGNLRSRGGGVIYSFEYQDYQHGITIPLGIWVVNGIVDMVQEQLVVYADSPLLDQMWERFALRSLLTVNGTPSRVGVILTTTEYYWLDATIFTMWLFYDDDGILIIYYDIATRVDTDYRICPNQPHFERPAPLQFSFWTQSPDNERTLEDAYATYTNTSGIPNYLSSQEAVGLEPDELFDLIISGEPGACFETPRDIWP
jgi:hypothetical protein